MNYPQWRDLEKLMEAREDVVSSLAQKYPTEIMRWLVLRKRQGPRCVMARGVLKLICYNEIRNRAFHEALEKQTWTEKTLGQ